MINKPPGVLTFELCRPLLERLVASLDKILGPDLEAIGLFGSIARDQGGKSSDIDLLIVHRRDHEPLDEFVRVLLDVRQGAEYQQLLEAGFYPEIVPLLMDLGHLQKHPWILLDVVDHGRILLSRQRLLEKELSKVSQRLQELGSRKIVLADGTWYWDVKPDWQPHETFDL